MVDNTLQINKKAFNTAIKVSYNKVGYWSGCSDWVLAQLAQDALIGFMPTEPSAELAQREVYVDDFGIESCGVDEFFVKLREELLAGYTNVTKISMESLSGHDGGMTFNVTSEMHSKQYIEYQKQMEFINLFLKEYHHLNREALEREQLELQKQIAALQAKLIK